MSFFSSLEQVFKPIADKVNPKHVEQAISHGVHQAIQAAKHALPGHVSLGDAVDIIKVAEPSSIAVDLFAGGGVDLGIELDMEFGMGVVWEEPIEKVAAIAGLIDNPPSTVHQLMDRMWGCVPAEIHFYERLQAVVGEQGTITWTGDDVLTKVCKYLDKKNWLEKKLR